MQNNNILVTVIQESKIQPNTTLTVSQRTIIKEDRAKEQQAIIIVTVTQKTHYIAKF